MNIITLKLTSTLTFKNYCKKCYQEHIQKHLLLEEEEDKNRLYNSYINLNFNALIVDYLKDCNEQIIEITEEVKKWH